MTSIPRVFKGEWHLPLEERELPTERSQRASQIMWDVNFSAMDSAF